jgi:hypothetical protein
VIKDKSAAHYKLKEEEKEETKEEKLQGRSLFMFTPENRFR